MGQDASRIVTTSAMTSNSAAVFTMLLKRQYVPLLTFSSTFNYNSNKKRRNMSSEQLDTISNNSTAVEVETNIDQTSQDFKSSVEERKQSVHSFRVLDTQQDTDSDKDLIIHSLHESLHIHKEILERIQHEKEAYQQKVEKEREEEKESMENWRQNSQRVIDEQTIHCEELESNIAKLKQELELKKEEYSKLEVNFYSYVKTIRVTDDDLSTIQPEISHLLSQLNNTCMGLKSKMNRQGGTDFVFQYWSDKADLIKKYMLKEGEESLDTSYITLFVEKYLLNALLTNILDVPIHLGISINDSFKELDDWMSSRNKEWSNRLRQQVCSLVVQQPGDEEVKIQAAKNDLLQQIVEVLGSVYPPLKNDSKKIENLISRTLKLNLAVKGQEIKIERLPIEEGVTCFNSETMKATAKGKPNGIVFLAITPPFIARDELDNEHGFTVPGKVFCIEEKEVSEDMDIDEEGDLKKEQEDDSKNEHKEEVSEHKQDDNEHKNSTTEIEPSKKEEQDVKEKDKSSDKSEAEDQD